MQQHAILLLVTCLAVLLNTALCETLFLAFKESRRDIVMEHRFKISRIEGFIPNTFDRTVNTHCSAGNTFVNHDRPNTLVCIKDGVANLLSKSDHQKSLGKISLVIPKVLVQSTSSTAKEKLTEIHWYDEKAWFYQNKTCMTGRRDPVYCIDKYGNNIVDATIQRKPCFFVHGVGERGDNTIKNSFVEYWGEIKDYMPQCNSFNFLYMDTKTYSWNSEWLVKKVCSLITAGSMKIVNSYVFTHSMGGLIMTNSLMHGWCQIDKKTSRLYMSQPPLTGSVTARFVNDICKGNHGDLLKAVADYMDYCLPDDQGAYPSYFPMDPDNPQLQSVQYAAGVFNDGMLCGNCSLSASLCGFGAPFQTAGLKAIAVTSGLNFPNDGMVALDSCRVSNPKYPFSGDSSASYYMGEINHADGTCRNGDSTLQSLYPCQWFGARYMN